MGTLVVVELPHFSINIFALVSRYEPFAIQAFVSQFAVEAFHKSVLPRATRFDVSRSDILVSQPFHYCCGGKFRSIV